MTTPDEDDRPLVLVAEDEPLASMALRAQLEALDYRVLGPARDGDEAVALGACFPVDVALFDVRMPARSGLAAALALFEIAPTPVVLLTGVGAADLPDPLPRPPVFEILNKPAGLADIAAALTAARSGFQAWLDRPARNGADSAPGDPNHTDRATIARAVEIMAAGTRPAQAASLILERARDQGRSPAEVARDILRDVRS